MYIIDVDGTRQVIDAMYAPGTTSAADRAEQEQIIASIRFEPILPAASGASSRPVVRRRPDPFAALG